MVARSPSPKGRYAGLLEAVVGIFRGVFWVAIFAMTAGMCLAWHAWGCVDTFRQQKKKFAVV